MKSPFFAALVCISCGLIGCAEKIKPSVLATSESQTLPQQESWNSTITVSDSGRVTAIINAGNLRVFELDQKTYLSQGVTVHFFSKDGKQTSILTSEEGSVDEITNNLEALKNVHVVSSDSSHMRTEYLMWNNSEQLIKTPENEFVQITTVTDKLNGYGFVSDQALKNYHLSRVTGESRTQ